MAARRAASSRRSGGGASGRAGIALGKIGWILLCLGLAVACGVAAASTFGAWRASRQAPPPPRGRIQLEVLNGCGRRGIAEEAARQLTGLGFDVVRTGNAARFDHQQSRVIDRSGQEGRAAEVARALGCRETERDLRPEAFLDATVIVGSDFGSLPGLTGMRDKDAAASAAREGKRNGRSQPRPR